MNQDQVQRIRSCFDAMAHRTPELADRFHTRLFAQHPALRAFVARDLSQHKQDFAAGLRLVVKNLHQLEAVRGTLMDIGAKQARSNVTPAHYGIAREVLLSTIREFAGPTWNEELALDWTEAINAAVSLMVLGAGRARVQAA